jgi:hypothetical protein
MSKFQIIILIVAGLLSCQKPRTSSNNITSKSYIVDYVDSLVAVKSLTNRPILIVDGNFIEYDKDNLWLNLKQDEIAQMSYLESSIAKNIYGNMGNFGAVLITSEIERNRIKFLDSPKRVLYILNGKKISKEEFENLNANDIIGTSEIYDKETIQQYSDDEYDMVFYIMTKIK